MEQQKFVHSSKRNNSTRIKVEKLMDIPSQPTLAYYPHNFKSIQHPIVYEIMSTLLS